MVMILAVAAPTTKFLDVVGAVPWIQGVTRISIWPESLVNHHSGVLVLLLVLGTPCEDVLTHVSGWAKPGLDRTLRVMT